MMDNKVKKLNHGDKVILNGNRGTVFTVRGYAKRYMEDADVAYNRAVAKNHTLHCITKEPAMLRDSKEWMGNEILEWQKATRLNDKEVVEIEGQYLSVRYKGPYSDMAALDFVDFVNDNKNEFNVNDTVYYMKDNKVHCAPILSKMKIENWDEERASTDRQKELWMPFGKEGIKYATCHGIFDDDEVFASKEDLLNNL